MQRIFLFMDAKWQDKTGQAQLEGTDRDGKLSITFDPCGKRYKLHQKNVALVQEREIQIHKDCVYRIGEKVINNPTRIVVLESNNPKFLQRTEVTFQNNETYTYYSSQVVALPPSHTNSLFQLLSAIAEVIKPDKEAPARDYLTKQYNRLAELTFEGTASEFLAYPEKVCSLGAVRHTIIYPFGSNLSQINAVDAAFANRLSVIEGPPGTGKTQTILNIIANLLVQKQSMLIASPNNEATKNIFDKLEKEGLGFLVATLGNKKNAEAFVKTQDTKKQYPASLKNWHLSKEKRKTLTDSVAASGSILRKIYASKQQLAKSKEALRTLKIEYEYFCKNNCTEAISCKNRTTLEKLYTLRNSISHLIRSEQPMTLGARLQVVFLWGIGDWHDYDSLSIDTELRIDKALFELGIKKLESQILDCEHTLSSHDSDTLITTVTNNSRMLLKDALYSRYHSKSGKPRRHFNEPWKEAKNFRLEYPIITSTTNAARNQMGKEEKLFDYIIIDEASQADLVTGFLALSSAKNAVVVGDTKQLPCVITQEEEKRAARLIKNAGLPQYYDYTKVSLLDCLNGCIEQAGLKAPRTLLKEHYRCHPDIIGFCNQRFYNGELIIMTDTPDKEVASPLFVSLSAPGNHDRKGDYNRIQAQMFTQDALLLLGKSFDSSEIGVATPYRIQAHKMTELEEVPKAVQVDTIHKYQGREKDAIVFITKANDINSFIDNPNLINVAVSRAKRALYLITAPHVVEGENNIADLKRWIEYHDGTEIVSEIRPAFPYLYSEMNGKKSRYLLEQGARIDDEYSEVQMKEYVLEVMGELKVEDQIGFCRNYPLKLLFSDGYRPFSDEEIRFIQSSAHADYLFFRKIDRSVILELEVNGAQHKNDPKQIRRDATKQAILEKAGIPQCTIQTNEEKNTALNTFCSALVKALTKENPSNTISSHHKTISVAIDSPAGEWGKENTKEY